MPGYSYRWVLLVLPLLLLGLGCNSKGLVKVSGKVTLDDKPLEGAEVNFIPASGGAPASGYTGSDGTFTLTTYRTGDGAKPGEYKVTVSKKEDASTGNVPSTADPQSMTDAMRNFQAKSAQQQAQRQTPKLTLPAEYSDALKTKLKCTVPADGPVEFNLRSSGGV
jgi:hypothetical protein